MIAGAGSGKTNTLAHRVARLLINGADAHRILLPAFTRRAVIDTSIVRVHQHAACIARPKHPPVIWCFNTEWMDEHCFRVFGRASVELGLTADPARYLLKRSPPAKLVGHDNPYFLNQRLTAHQGLFLLAGDICGLFCENLKSMKGWDSDENVLKLHLRFDDIERVKDVQENECKFHGALSRACRRQQWRHAISALSGLVLRVEQPHSSSASCVRGRPIEGSRHER